MNRALESSGTQKSTINIGIMGMQEEEQSWQQKKKKWRDIGPTLSKSDGKAVHTSNDFQANEFQIEYTQFGIYKVTYTYIHYSQTAQCWRQWEFLLTTR